MKNNLLLSKKRCRDYRKRILDISQQVKAIHAAGAFSSIEIVDAIYFYLMRKKKNKFIDTFLMSKGHGCMAQYVVLEKLNILKKKDLNLYCTNKGILGCHPDYGNPGIEASTGSLGHGMGLAVGMSHADMILKNNKKVFVLLSDGELQEGSTWENMMMAANLNLKNLISFVDHNGSQSFGITKYTHPKFYPLVDKIKSFGWECKEVDGHNINLILNAYKSKKTNKPLMVVCNTTKGKGVSFMENKPIWHYRSPNKQEYKLAIEEIFKYEK